mmetsp:Transcript_13097/g.18398  ORF Transcript_13097/g.18398 Transcript_13097/m.18398 type:complete len:260 (-) Transcript_13097:125-904(-)
MLERGLLSHSPVGMIDGSKHEFLISGIRQSDRPEEHLPSLKNVLSSIGYAMETEVVDNGVKYRHYKSESWGDNHSGVISPASELSQAEEEPIKSNFPEKDAIFPVYIREHCDYEHSYHRAQRLAERERKMKYAVPFENEKSKGNNANASKDDSSKCPFNPALVTKPTITFSYKAKAEKRITENDRIKRKFESLFTMIPFITPTQFPNSKISKNKSKEKKANCQETSKRRKEVASQRARVRGRFVKQPAAFLPITCLQRG